MVPDASEVGDSYERYIGRGSRRLAPLFLSWLRIPPGRRWLDDGCGTGALCDTIRDLSSPSAPIYVSVFRKRSIDGNSTSSNATAGQRIVASDKRVGAARCLPGERLSV